MFMEIIKRIFKDKDTAKKLLWTFIILIGLVIGYRIPMPGINAEYLKNMAAFMNQTSAGGMLSALMGNTFQQMSIFALSITPYISASIILQLLGVLIPKLGQLSKSGSVGREKLNKLTLLTAGIIAVIESLGLALSLGRSGLFIEYNALMVIFATLTWTAGACFLVWVGQFITKKLIGDGISLILLFNILSTLPSNFINIYKSLSINSKLVGSILICLTIAVIAILVIAYVVLMHRAEKKIKISNSNYSNLFMSGAANNELPLKLNMGGVMPIIFASSIMSTPSLIASILRLDATNWFAQFAMAFNQNNWFQLDNPIYSLGLLAFIPLVYAFSAFYMSLSFNPNEIADNLKKSGGIVNGVRPGKSTAEYLNKQMKSMLWIGTTMLLMVALVPTLVSGLFNINGLSFGGTSIIIIVSTILTLKDKVMAQTSRVTYKSLVRRGRK